MKTKDLKDNIAVLRQATAERVIQPILGNIYFSPGRMMATDLDFWAVINDPESPNIETTAAIARLEKMVNAVKTDSVAFKDIPANQVLELSAGALKTSVRTLPASEFPALPKIEATQKITFNFPLFIKELSRVVVSAKGYDFPDVLNGVLIKLIIEHPQNKVELVATDGSRIHVVTLHDYVDCPESFECIISAVLLKRIIKTVGKKKLETITLEHDPKAGMVRILLGKYEFYARTLDGQYPVYKQLIPRENKYDFTVRKSAFLEAINIVKPFANERTNIVKLNFYNHTVNFVTQTPDVGDCEYVICEYSGNLDTLHLAFNYKFIEDAVKLCEADEIIHIKTNGALSPVLFSSDDDLTYMALVMPVQVK